MIDELVGMYAVRTKWLSIAAPFVEARKVRAEVTNNKHGPFVFIDLGLHM